MRTLTANATAKLNQNTGTEWLVILEVEWVDNGAVVYSDQDLAGSETKVLSMAGFDTSMQLEGSNDSQELSIVLDDTDNSIRDIYNTNDIHKRPARVYLLHKGLGLEDKILVFKGEVVTPIQWSEASRTVSFNILSKLNYSQVGFSMEEGEFPNIPEEAMGKAWPLVFGQVCHLPAVKVRAPRRGYLETGVGIHDFTLEPRICQAVKLQCPSASTGNQTKMEQGANNIWTEVTKQTMGPSLECVNRRFGEICKLKDLLDQQVAYEYVEIEIYNGVSFPQDEPLTIFIDNATFEGTFSGNTFSITNRIHPEFADFDHQECQDVGDARYGSKLGSPQIGGSEDGLRGASNFEATDGTATRTHPWLVSGSGRYYVPNQSDIQAFQSCDEALVATPAMLGGPKESWELYDSMEASDFFWAPAGSEVFIEAESEILYIVSLLPGVVDGVAAFRTAPNGFKYLTAVPEDYYTVYETDYDGYQVVEIGMNKALSLYNDQWEDQIYVSFTSSVGGNPCDIIEWLVGKYTDMTIDSTTFTQVKAALTNYPKNFYLTTRPDVYTLIQDIAYQSRCSVYVRNGIMYIKYLSAEPTSERTINESDVLSGTFIESLSETEDVYTTHTIEWRKAGVAVRGDQQPERKLVLKYNTVKYGTIEKTWDYYTDNIYESVLKTGTFWLIRKANSWKKVRFQLPIKHMDLDVGDCITLDIAQFSTPVKSIIEKTHLNPDEYTIDVECWTPVRSGETSPFYWAWPAAQSQAQIWPLSDDPDRGAGYTFNVTPPTGHILLGGQHRDDQLIITTGDLHPSDIGDTLLTPVCELSDYINFDEVPPEIVAKEIAESAARAQMEETLSGGTGGGNFEDNQDDESACGSEVLVGCAYEVKVSWHRSDAQGQSEAKGFGPCGGPCACAGGCPSCYGLFWQECHVYGSASWAATAASRFRSQIKSINSYWDCGESAIYAVSVTKATAQSPGGRNCEDALDPPSPDSLDGSIGASA